MKLRKIIAFLLIIVSLMSTIAFASTNSEINKKEKVMNEVQRILKKYDCRLLSEKQIKELGFEKDKFKEMDNSITIADLEKFIVAQLSDINKVTSDESMELIANGKAESSNLSISNQDIQSSLAFGTVTETISKTFSRSGSYYTSNPLQVTYQVSATYTQDVTSLPGEGKVYSNKNFTSWSQGNVIQTGGYPYRRLTSYTSSVSKYSNTSLCQTGTVTCDNYTGITIGGYEVYIFLSTSNGSFTTYHSI